MPTEVSMLPADLARTVLHGHLGVSETVLDRGVFSQVFADSTYRDQVYVVTLDPMKEALYRGYGLLLDLQETAYSRPLPVTAPDGARTIHEAQIFILRVKRLSPVLRGITPLFNQAFREIATARELFPVPSLNYNKWDHDEMALSLRVSWNNLRFYRDELPLLAGLVDVLDTQGCLDLAAPNFGTAQFITNTATGTLYPTGCAFSVTALGLMLNRQPYPRRVKPGDDHFGPGEALALDDPTLDLYNAWLDTYDGLHGADGYASQR